MGIAFGKWLNLKRQFLHAAPHVDVPGRNPRSHASPR
jgi:hypothetical protein